MDTAELRERAKGFVSKQTMAWVHAQTQDPPEKDKSERAKKCEEILSRMAGGTKFRSGLVELTAAIIDEPIKLTRREPSVVFIPGVLLYRAPEEAKVLHKSRGKFCCGSLAIDCEDEEEDDSYLHVFYNESGKVLYRQIARHGMAPANGKQISDFIDNLPEAALVREFGILAQI